MQTPAPKSPPDPRQSAYGKLGQIFFEVFFSSIQNCSKGGTKYSGKHFQLLAGRGHARYLSLVPRVGNELRYKHKKPDGASAAEATRVTESGPVSVDSEKRQTRTGLRSRTFTPTPAPPQPGVWPGLSTPTRSLRVQNERGVLKGSSPSRAASTNTFLPNPKPLSMLMQKHTHSVLFLLDVKTD